MQTTSVDFNQKIIEHFTNPRNIGEIENADGFAVIGDPRCGDYIKVWIRIKDEIIIDFKYKVFGCWGAISTTSVVSELAIGKSLKNASQLTDDDVIKELGGMPANKQHCSLLGIQGLRTAIAQFLIKENHKKYTARIELYHSQGYDIPNLRDKMATYLSKLAPDAKILDVGTGKGHLALAIAKSGRKCTSVDISSEEIYQARLNAIHYKLDERIDFQQQDGRQLKFESNSFDAVLSAALMHHLIHPELVLTEMVRVCKSNGYLIISDLNENGQKIVDQVHQSEGRKHVMIGWQIPQIRQWFENQGYHFSTIHENAETILIIKNCNQKEA